MPPYDTVSCREAVQNLAFVIDCTPKVVRITVDIHEHLVQVQLPFRACPQTSDPLISSLRGKNRAKSIPPIPHSFVADVGNALVQQVLDIAERKRKSNVHHDRQAENLRAAVKVLEWVAFCHA